MRHNPDRLIKSAVIHLEVSGNCGDSQIKKFFKITGTVIAVLILLVAGVLVYVNNGGFIKRHVLPAIADRLETTITAGDVKFSIFGQLQLNDLILGDASAPFLDVETVRVRYHLMPMLSGEFYVDEVLLENTTVALKQAADGTFIFPFKLPETKDEPPLESVPEFAVKGFNIKNLKVTLDRAAGDETQAVASVLQNINVSIPKIALGDQIDVTVTADGSYDAGEQLQATFGSLKISLNANLPKDLVIKDLDVIELEELLINGMSGNVAGVPLDGRQLKVWFTDGQFGMQEAMGGHIEAELNAKSKLQIDVALLESPVTPKIGGELEVAFNTFAQNNQQSVLDLIGVLAGDYRFGDTTISYEGAIKLADNGRTIGSQGELNVQELTVASTGLNLEPLDDPVQITVGHDVTFAAGKELTVDALHVSAKAKGREILKVTLSKKATIALTPGTSGNNLPPSRLQIVSKDFDLSLLSPLIPRQDSFTFHGGQLTDDLDVLIENDGKKITATGTVDLSGVHISASEQHIKNLDVSTAIDVVVSDFERVTASPGSLKVSSDGNVIFEAILHEAVTVDISKDAATAELPPARLTISSQDLDLMLFEPLIPPIKGFQFRGGRLTDNINLHVENGGKKIAATGSITLDKTAFRYDQDEFGELNIATRFDAVITDFANVQFKPTRLRLRTAAREALDVTVNGELQIKTAFATDGTESSNIDGTVNVTELKVLPGISAALPSAVTDSVALSNVNLTGTAVIGIEATTSIDLVTNLRSEAIEIGFDGFEVPPLSYTVDLSAEIAADQMLRLRQCRVVLDDPVGNLATFDLSGNFDASMKGRKSELSLISQQPLVVDRFLDMMVTSSESPGPINAPDIWAVVNVALTKVTYGSIDIEDFQGIIVHKDGKVSIDSRSFKINGVLSNLNASCGYAAIPMTYTCDFDMGEQSITPLITTFAPKAASYIGAGSIKSFAIMDASGKGSKWPELMDQLNADISFEVTGLRLLQFSEGSLMNVLGGAAGVAIGVTPDDLSLQACAGRLKIHDGKVHLEEPLTIPTKAMILVIQGSFKPTGDMPGDLLVEAGFGDRLGHAVNLYRSVEPREDGYLWRPEGFHFNGSMKNVATYNELTDFVTPVPEIADKLGGILNDALGDEGRVILQGATGIFGTGTDGAAGALGGVFGTVGGLLGGDHEDDTKNENNVDPVKEIGDKLIFGLLGGSYKAEKKDDKEDEESSDDKKKDLLNNTIRGLFGN